MKNSNAAKTSAVLISLAVILASAPLPAFSAALVQMQAQPGAMSGGITVLPTNAVNQSVRALGSLPNMAGGFNLRGTLTLPQSPIVSAEAAAGAAVTADAGALAPAQVAPAVQALEVGAAVMAPKTELAVLAAQSVPGASAPVRRKSLVGRIADAVASKLSFAQIFDNSRVPALGAALGILPQKKLDLPGLELDKAPAAPHPSKVNGIYLQNYELQGPPNLAADVLTGGPTILQADPSNEAAVESALRAMIDADPVKYGVASSELATVHVRRQAGVGHQADTIYAVFQQRKDGLEVHGASLEFTIKIFQGRPVIVSATANLYPDLAVDTSQRLSNAELKRKALKRLGVYSQNSGLEADLLYRKIIYVNGAWHAANIYIIQIPHNSRFHAVMTAVDVATGEAFTWDPTTLRRASLDEDSAGSVAGRASGLAVDHGPILPTAEIKEIPLDNLAINIGGKTYITDKDGRFKTDSSLQIGPEGLYLKATLSGPYVDVQDSSGKTLSVNVTLKPGDGDVKVVFNPDSELGDESALAQVSAFQKVNLAYNFLKSRKVTTERMDKEAIAVISNVEDECNAYYTPGTPSLNFFKSSENCVNSAYDTVADHEYGHYWDDLTGGIKNGGLSEGWGDTVSMYLLNNPLIGEHFLKKPRPDADGKLVDYLRTGNNHYQYSESDEVHDQGQAWQGFTWKLRQRFMEELGDAAGAALAESLVLPTMFAKAADIPAAMAQVLLSDMDSNGKMPHEAAIRETALLHGITLPKNPGKIAIAAAAAANAVLGPVFIAQSQTGPQAPAPEQPQVRAKFTFTAGLVWRGRVKRELSRFLDEQDGITYELKEYKSWNSSDFRLVVNGPKDKVEQVMKSIQDWFDSISRSWPGLQMAYQYSGVGAKS